MAPFYGWGSTASRPEPLRGGNSLFTSKFPEIPGTHFIDLGRMKGWVDLEATHWFRMRDLWIGNAAKDTSSAQQWNKNVTKYSFESNNKIFQLFSYLYVVSSSRLALNKLKPCRSILRTHFFIETSKLLQIYTLKNSFFYQIKMIRIIVFALK